MSRTKESVLKYWDARSELFGGYYIQPSIFDKIFRKGIYERVAISINKCKELANPVVLDIGSGPGINSESIIKHTSARRLVGIDFSPRMIEYARKKALEAGISEKCEYILGDMMTYDFKGIKKFDFSIAMGVLDYVCFQDAVFLIRKVVEMTKNSFVISWPENGIRMWLRRQRYTCPVFHYNLDQIHDLHTQAGIRKLEVLKIGGGWASIADIS